MFKFYSIISLMIEVDQKRTLIVSVLTFFRPFVRSPSIKEQRGCVISPSFIFSINQIVFDHFVPPKLVLLMSSLVVISFNLIIV